ncbi:hypothetical protein MMC22_009563 [Lobaria immixta]|nr:hypothetical protein [Lobaria immixta]
MKTKQQKLDAWEKTPVIKDDLFLSEADDMEEANKTDNDQVQDDRDDEYEAYLYQRIIQVQNGIYFSAAAASQRTNPRRWTISSPSILSISPIELAPLVPPQRIRPALSFEIIEPIPNHITQEVLEVQAIIDQMEEVSHREMIHNKKECSGIVVVEPREPNTQGDLQIQTECSGLTVVEPPESIEPTFSTTQGGSKIQVLIDRNEVVVHKEMTWHKKECPGLVGAAVFTYSVAPLSGISVPPLTEFLVSSTKVLFISLSSLSTLIISGLFIWFLVRSLCAQKSTGYAIHASRFLRSGQG